MRTRTLPTAAVVLLVSAAASAASLTRGPALQNTDQDSAVVGLRLDSACAVAIRYGIGDNLDQTASSGSDTNHFVALEGLQPATRYQYMVEACGAALNVGGSFVTAPPLGTRKARFAAIGDMGTGGNTEVQNGNAMLALRPEFWVGLGDIAYASGTDGEFTSRFFAPLAPLLASSPVFPVPGNHEYVTNNAAPYFAAFDLPRNNPARSERYYSFDWGPVHVVAFDAMCELGYSSDSCNAADQKAFLESDLSASRAPWKVVMMHHPFYSTGDHQSTEQLHDLIPILEQHGVDLVLTGHDHNYERTRPMKGGQAVAEGTPGSVVYLVVGNGAATLRAMGPMEPWVAHRNNTDYGFLDVSIDGGTLRAKAVTASGKVIDEFTLQKELPAEIQVFAEPTTGIVPFTVQFTAQVDPAGAEVLWDFGDGQTATGTTVSHRFEREGVYTVTATAHAGAGLSAATIKVAGGVDKLPEDPNDGDTSGGPGEVGCGAAAAGPWISAPAALVALFALANRRRRRVRRA